MRRWLLLVLMLGAMALVPTRMRADVSETCVSAPACGYPCYVIALIQYTDPDGNTTYEFGSCCWCI
jgi:hypothetical protein